MSRVRTRFVDVYALTSAEVEALGAYLARVRASGVRPIGPVGALVVEAILHEAARLGSVAAEVKS